MLYKTLSKNFKCGKNTTIYCYVIDLYTAQLNTNMLYTSFVLLLKLKLSAHEVSICVEPLTPSLFAQ